MNIFPSVVTLEDGTRLTACRVVHDGRVLLVWRHDRSHPDADANGFYLAARREAVPSGTGPTWYAKTETGTLTFTRDSSDCGCGHPLKQYTPTLDSGAHRAYMNPEVSDA